MKNCGLIPLRKGGERWRRSEAEEFPNGAEFEEALVALEYFVKGYFFASRIMQPPLYVHGDFYGERTQAIYVQRRAVVTEDLLRMIVTWLQVPRWESWRVLVIIPEIQFPLTIYTEGMFCADEYFETARTKIGLKKIAALDASD